MGDIFFAKNEFTEKVLLGRKKVKKNRQSGLKLFSVSFIFVIHQHLHKPNKIRYLLI